MIHAAKRTPNGTLALGSGPLLRGFRLGVRGRLLCYGCAAFLWYVAWRLAGV